MVVAVILAGGVGSRVGADRPKQFIEIIGRPVLAYTAEIYQKHNEVDAIEIVCHPAWKEYVVEMIEKYQLTKIKWIADGGDTFQRSVINGMENLRNILNPDDYVMVHYGAAPFTSPLILTDALKVCRKHGMSVSCTPCYQLLGSNDSRKTSKVWIDRDRVTQIACPQCYRFGYVLDLYRRAEEQGLLEKIEPHTTSLMYAMGETLYQSYGDQTNLKITTKEDLELFEGYILLRLHRNGQSVGV